MIIFTVKRNLAIVICGRRRYDFQKERRLVAVEPRHIVFFVANLYHRLFIIGTICVASPLSTAPCHIVRCHTFADSVRPVLEAIAWHIVALVLWIRVRWFAPVSASTRAVLAITPCSTLVVVVHTSHNPVPVLLCH